MLLADIPFELILVVVAALIGLLSRVAEFSKKIRARFSTQMREKEQAEGIDLVGARQDVSVLHEAPARIRERPAEFDLDPSWTGVPMPTQTAERIKPPQPRRKPAESPKRLELGGTKRTKPSAGGPTEPAKRRPRRPAAKSRRATTSTLLRALKDEREGSSRRARRRRRRLGAALHDPAAVQRAVVLREILGPPRAARYLPHLTRR